MSLVWKQNSDRFKQGWSASDTFTRFQAPFNSNRWNLPRHDTSISSTSSGMSVPLPYRIPTEQVGRYCWWLKSCVHHLRLVVYPHYLQGFTHLRWCRIPSINSMIILNEIILPVYCTWGDFSLLIGARFLTPLTTGDRAPPCGVLELYYKPAYYLSILHDFLPNIVVVHVVFVPAKSPIKMLRSGSTEAVRPTLWDFCHPRTLKSCRTKTMTAGTATFFGSYQVKYSWNHIFL